MKAVFRGLLVAAVLVGVYSCANGKKIREKAPVALQQAYYSTWEGVDGEGGTNLFIPTENGTQSSTALDSVYFRGRVAKLKLAPENPDVYVGKFPAPDKRSEDFIMSSDPREEYGNKPPLVLKDFPFDLKHDEAVVSFEENGKTAYFKLSGIEMREDGEPRIPRPENIQH